jgi:hypothetical protein
VKRLRQFGAFWYDFIVGDDWRIAAGVIVTITAVFVAAHHSLNWWWLLPMAVFLFLGLSIANEVRRQTR